MLPFAFKEYHRNDESAFEADPRAGRLFLEFELLGDLGVSLRVFGLEILYVSLPIGDHGQKAAARMPVFVVFLKVFRQFLDFRGQKGDLNLRRAGICGVNGRALDNLGLLCR